MALIKDLDDRQMPLLDHLIELRNRLMYACAALIVGFAICYLFADHIYAFLVQPLADIYQGQTGRRMIYTGLTEAFFTYLKVAFWAGAFLTFPIVAAQLWMFIAPGLYRNEKQAFLPFLVATPVLFFLGGAIAYYVVFPLAWRFFLSFETAGGPVGLPIELEARVGEYLSLVMKLIFAFGLSFQLPVALTLMGRVGLISAEHARAQPQVRDRRRVRGRGDHHPARRDQPGHARDPAAHPLRDVNLRGANCRAPARRGRGGRSGGRCGCRRCRRHRTRPRLLNRLRSLPAKLMPSAQLM